MPFSTTRLIVLLITVHCCNNYRNPTDWNILTLLCWGDMSIREILFQWSNTIKIQLSVLVWYKADHITISLKINLFSPWYSWKIAELPINNNYSLTHWTVNTKKIESTQYENLPPLLCTFWRILENRSKG